MEVEFRDGDGEICRHATGILVKRLKDLKDAMSEVELDSTEIDTVQTGLTAANDAIQEDASDGYLEFPYETAKVQMRALRFYRGKLYKIRGDEEKQIIQTDRTDARIAVVDDLLGRLAGQTSMNLDEPKPPVEAEEETPVARAARRGRVPLSVK